MVDSLCQTNQPTKTNTNNNTWPVIQLHVHSNKAQPIFAKSSIHLAQVDSAVGRAEAIATNTVGSSPTGGAAFFMEKISNLSKHI